MSLLKNDLGLPDFLKKHLGFLNEAKETESLTDIWHNLADKYPVNMMLNDEYCDLTLTFKEFYEKVTSFAAGLQKLGIKKGHKIAFFSENSARWMVVDQAICAAGAVSAVRGSSAPHAELEYIYEHSQSVALVTDDVSVVTSLSKNRMNFKFILYIGNADVSGYKNLINIPCFAFDDFDKYSRGKKLWRSRIYKNDPYTIVYSSGTTGKPKGILLSHGNILTQITQVHPMIKLKSGKSILSVLPIWHMYERTCEYYALSRANVQHYTNVRNFKKDLIKYRPNYLFSVPRIWLTVYDSVMAEIKSKPIAAQVIFNFFLTVSKTTKRMKRILENRCIYHQDPTIVEKIAPFVLSNILKPLDKFAMKFVYGKIKNALGGRFIKGISGGGALAHHVEDFFEAIGVGLYVGYGLTETSPVLSVRKEEDNKVYSVGTMLQETEVKIVDPNTGDTLPQGEKGIVMVRGPQVMLGYYRDKEATDAVLSPDGWFNTGDLGWLTSDEHLVLTGRMKEIIVLSNGENIEADALEDTCLEIPYIGQIVITGQDRSSLTALVYANQDELERVLHRKPGVDPNSLKDFKSMLLNEINMKIKTRPAFRAFERISDIYFVKEPFSIDNGLMTQTMKIKKNAVFEHYKNEIAKMYKK